MVSVPVLSNTTALMWREFSKLVRLRINSPFFADAEVEIATTSGMARPNACGHAITITVTIRVSAKLNSLPTTNHTARVVKPTERAMMVSQKAALSPRCCVFDFSLVAFCTMSTTFDR
jgi:hypothetical protein